MGHHRLQIDASAVQNAHRTHPGDRAGRFIALDRDLFFIDDVIITTGSLCLIKDIISDFITKPLVLTEGGLLDNSFNFI